MFSCYVYVKKKISNLNKRKLLHTCEKFNASEVQIQHVQTYMYVMYMWTDTSMQINRNLCCKTSTGNIEIHFYMYMYLVILNSKY